MKLVINEYLEKETLISDGYCNSVLTIEDLDRINLAKNEIIITTPRKRIMQIVFDNDETFVCFIDSIISKVKERKLGRVFTFREKSILKGLLYPIIEKKQQSKPKPIKQIKQLNKLLEKII